jgi:hypothetical protein
VCPPTPKIISPKACQTTHGERRQITTKAIICATDTIILALCHFVASYYIHAPNLLALLPVMYDERRIVGKWSVSHSVQGKTICVMRRRSSLPTRLMWCESMGSNNNGGSLNSHALEFHKCQHNMVGFF